LFRAAVTRQVAGHDRISVWTPNPIHGRP
jgi:hypothetical protein